MQVYSDGNEAVANGVSVEAIGQIGDDNIYGHVYTLASGDNRQLVTFQRGPVKDHGVNGTTNEAVIAMVIHRLNFLNEKFPCAENAAALDALKEALDQLHNRTKKRVLAGVEGTNQSIPE